jgi:hypothetical protein
MQHLLDFIHEHSLEQQLYLTVEAPAGALALTWQRQAGEDDVWEVRALAADSGEEVEHVHYGDLLDHLEERGADLSALASELRAIVLTYVAVADVVLSDARQLLGPVALQQRLYELRPSRNPSALAEARMPEPRLSLTVVKGEAAEPSARTGKLQLVR